MNKPDKYLKIAIKAAKQSGKIFVRHFGKIKDYKQKNNDPRNLVTAIDLKIEKNIKAFIHRHFPDHQLMGEEFGWQSSAKKTGFKWYIDPIDGTSNYIQGLPLACISIALWDEFGPLVAVVYNPLLKQTYTAQRGKGAYLNGKKIKVSKVKSFSGAFGSIGWVERSNGVKLFAKIIRVCRKVRGLATSALQTCMVGNGILDFYVTRDLHIWDFAAAILIVKEAGGQVTDFQGRSLTENSSGIVASNGKFHNEILKTIK